MKERCGICRHFAMDHGSEEMGVCRRYPPTTLTHEEEFASFPIVPIYEWCGEYESAEQLVSTTPINVICKFGIPHKFANILYRDGFTTIEQWNEAKQINDHRRFEMRGVGETWLKRIDQAVSTAIEQ